MSRPAAPDDTDAALHVAPGEGVLARRPGALLFFPDAPDDGSTSPVAELVRAFRHGDRLDLTGDDVPRYAFVDWTETAQVISTIVVTSDHGSMAFGPSGPTDELTDLESGVVRAGGFRLLLPAHALPADRHLHDLVPTDPMEVDPPQFEELSDLEVTLAPLGPITYPDDDTDRTTHQPFDVRCRNGHANTRTATTCTVCGEAIETTARRTGPRSAMALADLELPDGRTLPIDGTLVIGRDPQAVAARVTGRPRLVRLDAPPTVSRTHVVVRIEHGAVTVTDCDSRGRSAIVRVGHADPVALTPWQPTAIGVGDTVHLGGPTTLAIVHPRRHPVEQTERPGDDAP